MPLLQQSSYFRETLKWKSWYSFSRIVWCSLGLIFPLVRLNLVWYNKEQSKKTNQWKMLEIPFNHHIFSNSCDQFLGTELTTTKTHKHKYKLSKITIRIFLSFVYSAFKILFGQSSYQFSYPKIASCSALIVLTFTR